MIKTNTSRAKKPIFNKKNNFINKYCDQLINLKNVYLMFAFIIPVVIMYIIYIAMEIHPFGNGSVLVLDLNGQ